jgi:hypothetical protein
MKQKVKIYRMQLSRVFPATHPRAGETTDFAEKIKAIRKTHTIRANYELGKKRIDEVDAGNAILIIYEWEGKTYRSAQKNLFVFGTSKPESLDLIYRHYFNGEITFINSWIGVQKSLFIPSLQRVAVGNEDEGKVHVIEYSTIAKK